MELLTTPTSEFRFPVAWSLDWLLCSLPGLGGFFLETRCIFESFARPRLGGPVGLLLFFRATPRVTLVRGKPVIASWGPPLFTLPRSGAHFHSFGSTTGGGRPRTVTKQVALWWHLWNHQKYGFQWTDVAVVHTRPHPSLCEPPGLPTTWEPPCFCQGPPYWHFRNGVAASTPPQSGHFVLIFFRVGVQFSSAFFFS